MPSEDKTTSDAIRRADGAGGARYDIIMSRLFRHKMAPCLDVKERALILIFAACKISRYFSGIADAQDDNIIMAPSAIYSAAQCRAPWNMFAGYELQTSAVAYID